MLIKPTSPSFLIFAFRAIRKVREEGGISARGHFAEIFDNRALGRTKRINFYSPRYGNELNCVICIIPKLKEHLLFKSRRTKRDPRDILFCGGYEGLITFPPAR